MATVIQRCGKDGNMCMAVESPGPASESAGNENYVFTTTASLENDAEGTVTEERDENAATTAAENVTTLIPETQIEFLDEAGNVIPEDDFNKGEKRLSVAVFGCLYVWVCRFSAGVQL